MKKTNNPFFAKPKYCSPVCFAFEIVSEGIVCASYGDPGEAGSQIPYIEEMENY